ncbi:alpha-protein kinase 3 [Mixophyes fleayi]|uniref:alpha-protein kinase 3 n=1 Tax=Mixophyes fleayi TaxID=3061075 RepID=UPI003F4DDB33
MGTRRPMNRINSGNGRYYDSHGSSNGSTSDSEDSNGSVYSPRADSRSYLLNVRPENRTTFCNIISQLTEETQPCFETTLKARAVSEGCDAKFICMVTGYPEPEVTWYKDDEEMDRYCGLPKYEILRNGKRHTLQIYKCSEEDAAIYQASARNNKGIVSCSGILEVGTMTEYKIHQRWFAKLKRKAEAKMREIEQSRKRVKENFEEGERLRALSPERIQRKRRFSSENKDDKLSLSIAKEDLIKVHIPDPNSRLQEEIPKNDQPHNVVNGFNVLETQQKEEVTTNGYAIPENIEENGKEFLAYVYETVEVITKKTALKESYAKKKKKDEAPPLTKVVSMKEETTQESIKKSEGKSPAPRRSRFAKDATNTTVEEKMEIQISPLTSNKRFAPSTASIKTGKTIAAKDTKKLKDSLVPNSKAVDSPIPKPGHQQAKGDVNFSLKDMYFGDSLPLPEGEKGTPALERDQNAKAEYNAHKVNPSKTLAQGQIKEVPKAAPRRSKEQRELSAGRKPPPTTNMKTEVPITAPVSKISQVIPESKSKCELPKPLVENSQESPTIVSVPVCDIKEHNVKKLESAVLVPPANLSPEVASQNGIKDKPTILNKDKSTFLEESHEAQALVKNKLSSVDPDEEKTRTETLQKLQNLEIEYMALHKAYALLQKQLEISQKAEAQKKSEALKVVESTEQKLMDATETKDMKTQEKTEDKLIKCSSSPVPVYMITDNSTKSEVIPVLDTVIQGEQMETLQMNEVIPSLTPSHSPVSSMECSSEERVKSVHDNQQMENVVSEPIADSREIKDVESDEVKVREFSNDSSTEHVNIAGILSSEVEMMEDVKDVKEKEDHIEVSRIFDKPILEDTSVVSLSGTTNTSEEVKAMVAEKESNNLTSDVLQDVQIQVNTEMSENVLDIILPCEKSSNLSVSSDQNQSVATLLRDVKKALESGVTNNGESSEDSSSLHSPMAIPQVEDHYEADLMIPLPHKEEKGSQELVAPEAKSIDVIEKQSEADLSTVKHSVTSQIDSQQNIQDNMSKQQEKQDHSLVTTLKNSLLMLLHIKTADVADQKPDEKGKKNVRDTDLQSPERTLSPPSSMKMYESGKDSDSPQSAESMHSSSTSGKLTPTSEEDMVQNVDSLPTSPTIPRMTESSKKGNIIAQVESAPLSPITSRKSSKGIHEGTILSKEDLSFSPSTSRRIAAKIASGTDSTTVLAVPSIVVGSLPSEKTLGNMHFDSQRDSNRKWRSTENLALIPSATPEELASGARRKIYLSKSKQLDDEETGSTGSLSPPSRKESPNVSPGLSRRSNSLLATQSPPVERRSPGTIRRMAVLDVPKIYEETVDKEKTSDSGPQETKDFNVSSKEDAQSTETKKVNDPYKAPQVIRKTRVEQFSDASGNLKLWCQFFNILSDSYITWYKDDVQVAKVKRCSGDEGQVALAIVQASVKDCGVYQCTIQNDYGSDSTDCLFSSEVLSGFIAKEEAEVGEEIEMTPMVFAKGLADSGYWGDKFFGRIVMEEPHAGMGFLRKSCRVKVIYGLEPMFESGKTSIIKIRNLITFGTKNESTLVEKNYDITIQECKIQNTTREYCKIFAAECRGVPSFGQFPEILPLNLIYRPANNIPYATIEEDLEGRFEKYCIRDLAGKLHMKNGTEIEEKCCTFQHWVYQWTNGNFLVTTVEGVGWKLTNIAIATKSKGYQGLKESCYPEVLEEFPSVHQCNTYCEMLGLKSLKATESLQPPPKPKGSRSPQMGRKTGSAQSSPQIQKKVLSSPQSARKGGVSPKSTRKATDTGDPQSGAKHKGNDGSTTAKPQ